jgi:phosphatidate cytidylyltransferase
VFLAHLAIDRTNLYLRIISAAILIPVALRTVWLGNPALLILSGVVVGFGLLEMRSIALKAGWGFHTWLGFGLAIVFLVLPVAIQSRAIIVFGICIGTILAGIVGVFGNSSEPEGHPRKAMAFIATAGSALYIGGLAGYIPALRDLDEGLLWVMLLLGSVWGFDIAAFWIGSLYGRHRLAPEISPGKTWEGVFGGLLGAVGVGLIAGFLGSISFGLSVSAAILMSISGQVGDLFESRLKRRANIKNSGWILPGHGGVLDRVDSLLFAGPVAYIFVVCFAGTS